MPFVLLSATPAVFIEQVSNESIVQWSTSTADHQHPVVQAQQVCKESICKYTDRASPILNMQFVLVSATPVVFVKQFTNESIATAICIPSKISA